MKKVNTHGLKMVGLKMASGNTGCTTPNAYDELFYNRSTGEVWTVFQCSIGHNSWTVYHDPSIIKIGETSEHMTMQEIADLIAEHISGKDF